MLILSTNVDQKSLETEFSIAICRPTGDKWQSETPFLSIFDPRSTIVKRVFDCCIYTLFNEGKTHLAKIKLFLHAALHIKYIFT